MIEKCTRVAAVSVAWTMLAGCAIRFTAPVEPPLPRVGRAPAPPRPQTEPVPPSPGAVDEISPGFDVRALRRTTLGLTGLSVPKAMGTNADAYFGLIRRLLETKAIRVADLSSVDQVGAMFERRTSATTVGYTGRLDHMLWVEDFVGTKYVLVVDPVTVSALERQLPRVTRVDGAAIDAYASARAKWVEDCKSARTRLASSLARSQEAWAAAEAAHKATLPWYEPICVGPCVNTEFPNAAEAHTTWLRTATSLDGGCDRPTTDPEVLRKKDGTAAAGGTTSVHVAQVRFRLMELPGGRVALTGRVVREATTPRAALDAALDGLSIALTTGKGR